MKIYHLPIPVPVPYLFESIGVAILLRRRKKKYGVGFRKIKLYVGNRLVKNRCAVVDSETYKKISQYDWQLVEEKGKPCYAVRLEGRKMVSMHRQIMNSPAGKVVHHKDGNGLNNTRENLRIVTVAENNRYCRKRGRAASSKYKGVSIHKRSGKWQVSIKYDGIHKSLGSYETEERAGRAGSKGAKEQKSGTEPLLRKKTTLRTVGKFFTGG
ncbi:MAG: HNH endonuclease [Planctomycetes bacterium]|nr:HNH endonuclease [Planctomycetota bacterium]MBU1518086.1 HNH endonuclease [Planctomycetota bacterium]MBU2458525.1 HNH endonuclease [Planctomycetota bacterium]MBU2596118.1 HNH endonuclease [Planctomycetota bacterium]